MTDRDEISNMIARIEEIADKSLARLTLIGVTLVPGVAEEKIKGDEVYATLSPESQQAVEEDRKKLAQKALQEAAMAIKELFAKLKNEENMVMELMRNTNSVIVQIENGKIADDKIRDYLQSIKDNSPLAQIKDYATEKAEAISKVNEIKNEIIVLLTGISERDKKHEALLKNINDLAAWTNRQIRYLEDIGSKEIYDVNTVVKGKIFIINSIKDPNNRRYKESVDLPIDLRPISDDLILELKKIIQIFNQALVIIERLESLRISFSGLVKSEEKLKDYVNTDINSLVTAITNFDDHNLAGLPGELHNIEKYLNGHLKELIEFYKAFDQFDRNANFNLGIIESKFRNIYNELENMINRIVPIIQQTPPAHP